MYDVQNFRVTTSDIPIVAFKVYDVDRDGFISNGELFLVLKMMVGNNLKVGTPTRSTIIQASANYFSSGPAIATNRRQDDHGSRSRW